MHPHNQSPSSSSQYLYGSNSSISLPHYQSNPDFPPSLSQLLLGGLGNEQQEVAQTSLLYGALDNNDGFHGSSSNNNRPNSSCSQILMPSSSPTSCVTSLSSNSLLNFSNSQADGRNQHQENSSHECNSSSSGGVPKKPKIQHSSPQPVLKVRKEKLGDRITALHQLVSPFGKTDTASVLSEVIGYIRFLQAQIEVVSSPYLGNVSGGGMAPQHQQQCEPQQDRPKGLKSRGLCLVPVSCIQHFRSDNGAQLLGSAEELASWNDTSNINSSHFIN